MLFLYISVATTETAHRFADSNPESKTYIVQLPARIGSTHFASPGRPDLDRYIQTYIPAGGEE